MDGISSTYNGKIKLHFFGTCAGTQPKPNFHHVCMGLETENSLYFLDAGECGGYTAHLMGVDLLKTRAIFITHPHLDHVGGLCNLLWYIRKVGIVRKSLPAFSSIHILTPCKDTVDGVMQILSHTEGHFSCDYTHTVTQYDKGVIYKDENITVTAIPTHHIPKENGRAVSYGFMIEAGSKTIVFSGDMRIEDISSLLPKRVDAFLVETGHHTIKDVTEEIRKKKKQVDKLFFVHHGASVLNDIEGAKRTAHEFFSGESFITLDGETYEI